MDKAMIYALQRKRSDAGPLGKLQSASEEIDSEKNDKILNPKTSGDSSGGSDGEIARAGYAGYSPASEISRGGKKSYLDIAKEKLENSIEKKGKNNE